jgi:predicted transcriptional regulator
MPRSPVEADLAGRAMANLTRRKIIELLSERKRSIDELEKEISKAAMIEYHLKVLEQLGLIEIRDKIVELSDLGKKILKNRSDRAK